MVSPEKMMAFFGLSSVLVNSAAKMYAVINRHPLDDVTRVGPPPPPPLVTPLLYSP